MQMSASTPKRSDGFPVAETKPLLLIACALIVNSHLEPFYPLSYLAADGLLGNSLFFFMSGFGIQASALSHARPFKDYALRRIMRLYPSVIICMVVFDLLINRDFRFEGTQDVIAHFVWPTHYTYIRLIVIFYVVLFLFTRWRWAWRYPVAIGLLCIAYLWAFSVDVETMVPGTRLSLGMRWTHVHDIAYLQVTLLGAWAATQRFPDRKPLALHALAVVMLASYFALKYLMVVKGILSSQYWILHLLILVLCLILFLTLTDRRLVDFLRQKRVVWSIVSFVSALTLEIYLVHSYLVEFPSLSSIVFPLNIALFLIVSCCAAWLLHRINLSIRQPIEGRS